MLPCHRRDVLASFALAALSADWLLADEGKGEAPATPAKPAGEEKWRSLFDGKTLKNWKDSEFGGAGSVKVEEGQIVIGKGEPLTGITWNGAELPKTNYEVRLQGQRIDGDDFFCALTFPVKESSCSLVLGGWGGGVIGLSSLNGYDASENETTGYYQFDRKKWYSVRLVVLENRIVAWLQDERIVNVDTTGMKISIRIEVDPCRPFGISSFRTVGGIKDLKVRELTKDEVAKIQKEAAE
jgi:hypothetical protein